MDVAELRILIFLLAFAVSKAFADGRWNDNQQWHIWNSAMVFAGGFMWAACIEVHGFGKWWMPLIAWGFAQPIFEFSLCIVRDYVRYESDRPKDVLSRLIQIQTRTLHLNEIHPSWPLKRFKGWRVWVWDALRIIAMGGLYILLR